MLNIHDGDVHAAAEGLGCDPKEILDFSGSVTPAPIPETVKQALAASADAVGEYPDPDARRLRQVAAAAYGVTAEEVLAGKGAEEFLHAVPRRFRARRVVLIAPCSQELWRGPELAAAECEGVLAAESAEFVPDLAQFETRLYGADMACISNPNNPTGVALAADAIRAMALRFPTVIFVVDESFVECAQETVAASLLGRPLPPNLIALRSLTPFYGAPGLQVGFMIASREICRSMAKYREPWTLNVPTLAAAAALLECGRDLALMRANLIAERERLREALSRLTGLRVFKSQANFLLLKVTKPGLTTDQLCDRMLKQKMLIRNAAVFRGIDNRFVRVSVRLPSEDDRLIQALAASLDEGRGE